MNEKFHTLKQLFVKLLLVLRNGNFQKHNDFSKSILDLQLLQYNRNDIC
jgi:hypothetical protein